MCVYARRVSGREGYVLLNAKRDRYTDSFDVSII